MNIFLFCFSIAATVSLFLYMILFVSFLIKHIIFDLPLIWSSIKIIANHVNIQDVCSFLPLLSINFLSVLIFILLFFFLRRIHMWKFIEVYIYLKFVCNAKTLACWMHFVPVNVNIKFVFAAISFMLIANAYDFVCVYDTLSKHYTNTNMQFRERDLLVRYQVANKFIEMRAIEMLSSHHILLSDAGDIIDLYDTTKGTYKMMFFYDNILLNERYAYNAAMLTVVELTNLILLLLVLRVFRRLVIKYILRI